MGRYCRGRRAVRGNSCSKSGRHPHPVQGPGHQPYRGQRQAPVRGERLERAAPAGAAAHPASLDDKSRSHPSVPRIENRNGVQRGAPPRVGAHSASPAVSCRCLHYCISRQPWRRISLGRDRRRSLNRIGGRRLGRGAIHQKLQVWRGKRDG